MHAFIIFFRKSPDLAADKGKEVHAIRKFIPNSRFAVFLFRSSLFQRFGVDNQCGAGFLPPSIHHMETNLLSTSQEKKSIKGAFFGFTCEAFLVGLGVEDYNGTFAISLIQDMRQSQGELSHSWQ